MTVCAFFALWVGMSLRSGRGTLIEFSPDSLEFRERSEVLFWGTDLPVYRGAPECKGTALTKHLVEKGHWQPDRRVGPRWRRVRRFSEMFRSTSSPILGILVTEADFWIARTEENQHDGSIRVAGRS